MRDLLAALGPPTTVRRRLASFFARLNAGPAAPHAWLGNEPARIAPGGQLGYTLGPTPSALGAAANDAPPSFPG